MLFDGIFSRDMMVGTVVQVKVFNYPSPAVLPVPVLFGCCI
jgi:hypothetical protein